MFFSGIMGPSTTFDLQEIYTFLKQKLMTSFISQFFAAYKCMQSNLDLIQIEFELF